jgi:dihydrodipicolinate reductase
MKIVVIGGSGLIGSKLVTKLREQGHETLAASLDSGVNTLTGEDSPLPATRCASHTCSSSPWPPRTWRARSQRSSSVRQ